MHSDKFIFFFLFIILFSNFFIIKNFKSFFLYKTVDKEFNKPQAFHVKPVPRIGGILIFFNFILFSLFFLEKNFFLLKVLTIISPFFLIGFLSDINLKITPYKRLLLMITVSFFLIYFFDIRIFRTQFFLLDNLINSHKFISVLFVCLCLVFISNGCNFIDGFNGLLLIHIIIILSVLYFINYSNENNDLLKYLIISLILILISVSFYNFPKAKIFLGDSGAYFLGIITSLVVIEVSSLNVSISPFFFACLLFYIFFEVFFSFFRKIFFDLSPLKPDKEHLHMLFFKWIFSKVKNLNKANYLTGLFINIFYLLTILPLLFNYKNMTFCKIYFFILLNIYLFAYYALSKKSLRFKAK
jgi:UDP-GlcNAc:undecaprenyl-phosphate GlcNAc-1-phosphate transferase